MKSRCLEAVSILFGYFCGFTALWMPSAFFSEELSQRGISPVFAGLYISLFSVPCLFVRMLLTRFSARCGRTRLMLVGLMLGALFTALQGPV